MKRIDFEIALYIYYSNQTTFEKKKKKEHSNNFNSLVHYIISLYIIISLK